MSGASQPAARPSGLARKIAYYIALGAFAVGAARSFLKPSPGAGRSTAVG